jgi:hypothetical protein
MFSESIAAIGDDLQSCRAIACADGLERGLIQLHARLDSPDAMIGAYGYSMVPPSLHELLPRTHETVARQATDTGELIIARAAERPEQPSAQWWTGIAWIRLGAVERLSRRATDRLVGRKIHNRPTISLALVRATVGDVAAAVAEAAFLLADSAEGDLPRMRDRFDELVDFAVRASLKQFGASGYVLGPPADLAFAITQLGEVYGGDERREPR